MVKEKEKDARALENDWKEWKSKYLKEQERADKAEVLRLEAQGEAEELAASKKRSDAAREELERLVKVPNKEIEERHQQEIAAMKETLRENSEAKEVELEKQKAESAQWREAAMDAA